MQACPQVELSSICEENKLVSRSHAGPRVLQFSLFGLKGYNEPILSFPLLHKTKVLGLDF